MPSSVQSGKPGELPAWGYSVRLMTSREEVILPQILELYDYWREKADDRPAPHPSDIDLLDLHNTLSSLLMVDVRDEGREFILRFVGNETAMRLGGREITGMATSLIADGALKEHSLAVFNLVVASGAPVLDGPRRTSALGRDHLSIQSIALPLVDNGIVQQILILVGQV